MEVRRLHIRADVRTRWIAVGLVAFLSACGGSGGAAVGHSMHSVVVNVALLDDATVESLHRQYRVEIADGRYWYDDASGLVGVEGQPPIGFFVAHLHLGGPLRSDASNGDTGVFVNGRELSAAEVAYLSESVMVVQGRYWLDATGDVGAEGSSDVLFNLFSVVGTSTGGGGRDNFYSNGLIDSASNSQGGCTYISVDGTNYTSGCG